MAKPYGRSFPPHILAWGRYPFFKFISNRKLYLIVWSNVEIRCLSTCVSTKLDTEYSVVCCNLWPKHTVMFALRWAGKEWNGCSSNLIPTRPSQFPGTGSNNPETLLTHTSVPLHTLPLFPQEWLGTYLPFSLAASHPAHTHKQSYTHRTIQGGGDFRTSLVLLKVWSTLNSDHIAQDVVLLGLENLQRWRFHSFSGHPVLVAFVLDEFHDVPSLACSSSLILRHQEVLPVPLVEMMKHRQLF